MDKEYEEYKRRKKEAKQRFTAMQNLPYEVKIKRAELRAHEFISEMEKRGCNAHVSVGGLDSITLLLFLRSIGIDVPAISVSNVEDKSIQRVHKMLGVITVKSYKTKVAVLNEVGFPVISKRIAGKIDLLQHPTENNKTVRHAIITGECGQQGHFAKNSRMQLPQKWLRLFAGVANEEYGTDYKEAPFLVSNKCCYYLKEKPCDDWAKEHNSFPFLGMMASEGGQIEQLPAIELLKRYDTPDVFIYLDPPYLHDTRKNYLYKHEMSDQEHEELLDLITNHKGRILISGYNSDLYNYYLKGWRKAYKDTCAENGLKRTEVLWMNYQVGQMSLKDFMQPRRGINPHSLHQDRPVWDGMILAVVLHHILICLMFYSLADLPVEYCHHRRHSLFC